jgi:DNA invertase Pin-like site-specific DNA recombinase
LALYRRAWLNTRDYFEAATKYMALADKASRTVALEFERSMIKQRVKAGLRRAVAQGKTLGRPKLAADTEAAIRVALAEPGRPGLRQLATRFGVSRPTIQRIAGEPQP